MPPSSSHDMPPSSVAAFYTLARPRSTLVLVTRAFSVS